MKEAKIRLDMPALFKADIICLVRVINRNEKEKIQYWKKCVDKNIDEALKLEILTDEEANDLRNYYELEEVKVS